MTKDEYFKLIWKGARDPNPWWSCSICQAWRPDPSISVAKHRTEGCTTNIRYCNDNPECEEAAHKRESFTPRGESK